MSRALLAHAFCSHWHCLADLPYQPEAHRVTANFTAREQIARPQQDFVRLPMRAVHHQINPAPAAECTGKKIVSGIDAFHRTSSLNLPPVEVGRVRGGSSELDSSVVVPVARDGSKFCLIMRRVAFLNAFSQPSNLLAIHKETSWRLSLE